MNQGAGEDRIMNRNERALYNPGFDSPAAPPVIAIDFESHLISESSPVPKPVCLSAYDGSRTWLIKDPDIKPFLKKLFESNTIIIAHNAKFENLLIYKYYLQDELVNKLEQNHIYCTLIGEKVLNNVRKIKKNKMSLDALVQDYFDEDISAGKKDPDAWRLRYQELEDVPLEEWPEMAKDYAIQDSVYAYNIYQEQQKLFETLTLRKYKPQNLNQNVFVNTQVEFFLNLMAQGGIKVDLDKVQSLEQELKEAIDPLLKDLEKLNLISRTLKGYKKNVNGFREYIENKYPKEILVKTKEGTTAIGKLPLETYMTYEPDDNIIKYQELVKMEKIQTSFVKNLKQSDVIRTEYNTPIATGRTSSRKSSFYPSVNIQQMPREVPGVEGDIRNCFVPRPGYLLCSIDYAGLELAAVAHRLYMYYNKSKMRDLLNSGNEPVDMHSMLAVKIRNMSNEEKINYETFLKKKKERGYAEYRQLAKPLNLSFPGGVGYDTMRMLLFQNGIKTKYEIVSRFKSENQARYYYQRFKKEEPNLRITRLAKYEYALVYDELVGFKKEFYKLYPELKWFLTNSHERFLTGEIIKKKNEFKEWENEPVYRIIEAELERDYCFYTELCNCYLMQAPGAKGAKRAITEVIKQCLKDDDLNPLAFIHDEILFEVKQGPDIYNKVSKVAEIMIDQMQTVLPSVRITVEADLMEYWDKSGGFWSKQYWKDYDNKELKYD